jgi:hypothetical protein
VTLPDPEVLALLSDRFVLGVQNIDREKHVGLSHGYRPTQTAIGTTNGAGGRNVQIVVLASDETVLHVLPGFWHAEDLLAELRFALELHTLHRRIDMSPDAKVAMFRAMHRSFVRRQPPTTVARSDWQDFDRNAELSRAQSEPRDTIDPEASGQKPSLKPICRLVHDRMMARPFRKLGAFDMESFVDYGRAYYDNNEGYDKGRKFSRAEQANKKRQREQAKAQKTAQR